MNKFSDTETLIDLAEVLDLLRSGNETQAEEMLLTMIEARGGDTDE